LFFDGFNHRRQKAIKAQGLAFEQSKRGAFVQRRGFKQSLPAQARGEPECR
jgi:hypothetical protein